jgi:hypothetical protein
MPRASSATLQPRASSAHPASRFREAASPHPKEPRTSLVSPRPTSPGTPAATLHAMQQVSEWKPCDWSERCPACEPLPHLNLSSAPAR